VEGGARSAKGGSGQGVGVGEAAGKVAVVGVREWGRCVGCRRCAKCAGAVGA